MPGALWASYRKVREGAMFAYWLPRLLLTDQAWPGFHPCFKVRSANDGQPPNTDPTVTWGGEGIQPEILPPVPRLSIILFFNTNTKLTVAPILFPTFLFFK